MTERIFKSILGKRFSDMSETERAVAEFLISEGVVRWSTQDEIGFVGYLVEDGVGSCSEYSVRVQEVRTR